MEHNPRKLIGIIIGIVFFVLIIIFGFNRFGRFIDGPHITAINLQEYSTIQENPIIIEGSLANTSRLNINGVSTSINDDFSFRRIIVIPTGNSIIEIDMYDTFNNHRQYQYYVSYVGEDKEYSSTLIEAHNKQLEENQEAQENTQEALST